MHICKHSADANAICDDFVDANADGDAARQKANFFTETFMLFSYNNATNFRLHSQFFFTCYIG